VTSYRTPLSRVRGLGSAKHGVGDFIVQRVSGAALVLLLLWGVYAAIMLARGGYAGAVAWLHAPINAAGGVLIITVAALHMHIGMREIILDYIERNTTKALLMVANTFLCALAGVLGVICLLRVAFMAAGV
jgi:succinate dehydrogenase / fumarate reductase, membrane anchor subunit